MKKQTFFILIIALSALILLPDCNILKKLSKDEWEALGGDDTDLASADKEGTIY